MTEEKAIRVEVIELTEKQREGLTVGRTLPGWGGEESRMSQEMPVIITEVERDPEYQTRRLRFFVQLELDEGLCGRLGLIIRSGNREHPLVKQAECALVRAFYQVLEGTESVLP